MMFSKENITIETQLEIRNLIISMRQKNKSRKVIQDVILDIYGIRYTLTEISAITSACVSKTNRQASTNDINIVRELYSAGMSRCDIAKKMNISRSSVSKFTSVIDISHDKLGLILSMLKANESTYDDIADEVGVSSYTVNKIACQYGLQLKRAKNNVNEIFFTEYLMKNPYGNIYEMFEEFYEKQGKEGKHVKPFSPSTVISFKRIQELALKLIDVMVDEADKE